MAIADADQLARAEAEFAYHAEVRPYAEGVEFSRYDLPPCRRYIVNCCGDLRLGWRAAARSIWATELRRSPVRAISARPLSRSSGNCHTRTSFDISPRLDSPEVRVDCSQT